MLAFHDAQNLPSRANINPVTVLSFLPMNYCSTLRAASQEDDKVDADGDGIADVEQLNSDTQSSEWLKRKVG
eukprot:SAG31_NODE_1322_length_8786_cov_2.268576_2_plen_72_part_00